MHIKGILPTWCMMSCANVCNDSFYVTQDPLQLAKNTLQKTNQNTYLEPSRYIKRNSVVLIIINIICFSFSGDVTLLYSNQRCAIPSIQCRYYLACGFLSFPYCVGECRFFEISLGLAVKHIIIKVSTLIVMTMLAISNRMVGTLFKITSKNASLCSKLLEPFFK